MYYSVVFIELEGFTDGLRRLPRDVADEVLRKIQSDLMSDPLRGDLVPGLGGIRKARVGDPSRGKGKRGGFRYMYVYVHVRDQVYLLFLYSKGEQADITTVERKRLHGLAEELKKRLG